jgi:hypothetical protein
MMRPQRSRHQPMEDTLVDKKAKVPKKPKSGKGKDSAKKA